MPLPTLTIGLTIGTTLEPIYSSRSVPLNWSELFQAKLQYFIFKIKQMTPLTMIPFSPPFLYPSFFSQSASPLPLWKDQELGTNPSEWKYKSFTFIKQLSAGGQRCRLSWMTNSSFVYELRWGGGGGGLYVGKKQKIYQLKMEPK